MRYGILGPLELTGDDGPVPVTGAKQRALLVLLLLHANRVVSVDRLIDELWAGHPPSRATVTLRSYVSMLRRALEPGRRPGAASVLAWQPPGYVLRVAPDALDAVRFERLTRDGRDALPGDPATADELLSAAQRLWRGEALADVAFEPFAQGEIARLTELRLASAEDRVEARLALGGHAELVADLERLVAASPLRERLRGQLMLALYRSGRQADALRFYRDGRALLVDELGIEPGPALQRLQEEILLQSPTLDWRPPGRVRTPAARGRPGSRHAGARAPSRRRPGGRMPGVPAPDDREQVDAPDGPPMPAPLPPGAAVLVGRDVELAELGRALDGAVGGRGRLVLIAGDPGIGKTRLADEAAALAAARGAQVHRGACYELEGAPPFWPWVQVVRSVAEQLDDAELRKSLGPGAAYVAQVAPELGERVAAPAPVLLDGEAARFRAYDAVARFLGRVAARQPLLLVLDDLHWADLPSLRLLGFVAGGLQRTPALVVATYRAGEVRPGHPLAETLARLAREPAVERMGLGALTEADVARLVAGQTGAAVPGHLSARLHRRTGGNPFLLGELLRLAGPEGSLDEAAASEVPATVREVIGERLARLPGEAAEVLTVAALAPDAFGVEALAAVSGLPAERVLELVEAALAARLVVEDPEGRGGWRFAHDLVREAVYEGLSTARRARLHAGYGEALEAVLGPRAAEAAAELAHHFCQAAACVPDGWDDPEGLAAKGMSYSRLAAEQASARLAYEDAAGHYQRALAVLDQAAGAPAPRVRCELLLGLGDARRRSGDVVGARACLEPAFELARELGEPTWMARAALGFNSGSLWASWLDLWQPDEPSVRLLDGARAALGEGDSSLKASLLAQLAVNFHTEDELSMLSGEALGMARRLRDPHALSDALTAQLITWPVAGADDRLAHADELVAMAEAAGLPEPAALGRQYRVILLLQRGDAPVARAELARFARTAKALQQPLFLVHLYWLRSMWALLEGRLEETEHLAQEAFEHHHRANPVGALPARTAQLSFLRHEQGRLAEMEPAVRRWAAEHPQTFLWQALLLLLLASSDRAGEARELLARLAAGGVLGYGDNGPFPLTPDQATPVVLAEAIALLRDAGAAEELYQRLAPFEGRVVVTNTGLLFGGAVDHWLGRLAATAGREADARRHLDAALLTHERMGARPLLARTRLHLAELLLDGAAAGDQERARALLDDCLADAATLGMTTVAARARDRQAPGNLGERLTPA